MNAPLRAGLAAAALAPGLLLGWQPVSCTSLPPVSLERAACHGRLRQWKQAEEVYGAYLKTHGDSVPAGLGQVEALLHLKEAALLRHDTTGAVQCAIEASGRMQAMLEAHPEDPALLKAQASLLAQVEKNPREVEDVLSKITRIAPRDADAWSLLGSFYLDGGRAEDGIRSFERAVALDPVNPLYRAGLARGYAAMGRNEEARSAFAAASAAAKPDSNPAVFLWYGDFLASAERFDESAAAYLRVIAADPENGRARLRRASVKAKAGRYREAEKDALDAIARGAPEREVQALLIRIYEGLGDAEKKRAAALALGRAGDAEEERRGKWVRAKEALGRAERLMQDNHFAEALPLYVSVTDELPDYADAWFAAGVCHSQTGDAQRGEQALRTFLRLQPLSAEGHTALGVLLLTRQRRAEAQAELREALRLDPDSAEAKEALAAAKR